MKKQLKTYEIIGHISCSMVFCMNKIRVRVNFEGGSLSSQGVVPAIYKTSDALIQHIIESSDRYKSGAISLKECVDLGGEDENDEQEGQDGEDESKGESGTQPGEDSLAKSDSHLKEYPEVTNFQTAKSILMGKPYHVPLAELQSKDELLTKAQSIGVSFPNMK